MNTHAAIAWTVGAIAVAVALLLNVRPSPAPAANAAESATALHETLARIATTLDRIDQRLAGPSPRTLSPTDQAAPPDEVASTEPLRAVIREELTAAFDARPLATSPANSLEHVRATARPTNQAEIARFLERRKQDREMARRDMLLLSTSQVLGTLGMPSSLARSQTTVTWVYRIPDGRAVRVEFMEGYVYDVQVTRH